eukprot:6189503-Pleurochrysis_carterae.AAC.2
MLYAPGDRTLRPRLIPTHARASIVVLEYATRGFTAYARQPKGSMLMMRGLIPVSSSYDDASVLGGPLVRLRMSTALVTAKYQKPMGTPLDVRDARVSSMLERIARSATPLS